MKPSRAADAEYLLSASPPALRGLSRKSPSVAPSGLVRINAAQNREVLEVLVQKYAAATSASRVPNINAAPSYPRPAVSAVQSPRAVPSVCENMMVTQ